MDIFLTKSALLSTVSFQTTQSQDSPLPSPPKKSKSEWPKFHNNGVSYSTEFESNTWKCPLCSFVTGRIKQHLASRHKDLIHDWAGADQYCQEISVLKRKELERHRAQDPTRRELKRKADALRAAKPERKEVLKKADAKRADQPERKEVLKRADAKRAVKPERKEVLKRADAKRADQPERKEAKRKVGRKVDSKRADQPERKEVLKKAGKKADAKRADQPER